MSDLIILPRSSLRRKKPITLIASARKDTAEIAKPISAFANAAGGKLVIGIEDDGTVSGFKRDGARAIEDFKRAAITDCAPSPAVTSKELSDVKASMFALA